MYDDILVEKSFLIKAAGFSMHPFVKQDDRLIIKKSKVQDLKIGDIILYKDDFTNQNICHRLVKKINSKNDIKIFARGDASGNCESVSENLLIGCAVGIIRNGKVLSLRTKQKIFLNWLITKFYLFFRVIFFLQRKLLRAFPATREAVVLSRDSHSGL